MYCFLQKYEFVDLRPIDCYGNRVNVKGLVKYEQVKTIFNSVRRLATDQENNRWLIHDTETWFPVKDDKYLLGFRV